jgi:hypothetical protein
MLGDVDTTRAGSTLPCGICELCSLEHRYWSAVELAGRVGGSPIWAEVVRLRPSRSARTTPDQVTTHCDLNITLAMEIGIFLVGFQYCRDAANQPSTIGQELRSQ